MANQPSTLSRMENTRILYVIGSVTYSEERENAEWRNVEIHTVQNTIYKERKRSNLRSSSSGSVIYTVHLSSFTSILYILYLISKLVDGGNYSSFLQFLPYLKELGVTTIRLLPIDIHSCDSDKTINPHCWCNAQITAIIPRSSQRGLLRTSPSSLRFTDRSVFHDPHHSPAWFIDCTGSGSFQIHVVFRLV